MAVQQDRHSVANYPDMDPSVHAVSRALERTLQAIIDEYERLQVPLPARRYWTTGQPVFDCDQVVVAFIGYAIGAVGSPEGGPVRCQDGVPRTMSLEISIVRPAAMPGSGGQAPSPASIQKHAEWQAIDAHILLEALPAIDVDEYGTPGLGVFGQVATPSPEGGYAATVLSLSLGLV